MGNSMGNTTGNERSPMPLPIVDVGTNVALHACMVFPAKTMASMRQAERPVYQGDVLDQSGPPYRSTVCSDLSHV
jgi:hypothetical protein